MKKKIITLLILLSTSFANAEIFPIFNSDGTKVKLIIQGNDGDAKNLFEAMQTDTLEENNILIKSIIAPSSNGLVVNLYELTCQKSLIVENLNSCTLSLDSNYVWTTVSKEDSSASVFSNGFIDTYIAYSKLRVTNDSNVIFKSEDNSLVIAVMRNAAGEIFRFRIQYNEL